MSYTTTNISFCCREAKKNKQGLAPVELVININKERSYITLQMKLNPEDFKKDISSKKTNSTKQFVESTRSQINNLMAQMVSVGMKISTNSLKIAFKEGINTSYTINDLFVEYLKLVELKSKTYYNYRKYELVKDLFFEIVDKNKEASELSNADILLFEAEVSKRFKNQTPGCYMTRLKSFINYGVNNNKIKVNPFYGVKIKKEKTKIELFSEEEYRLIRDKKITIDRIGNVRDLCIIQANCGLAYGDLISLSKEDFQVVGGSVMINKERLKTGVDFHSVVLEDGVKILKKYDYDISSLVISNQKMNAYLKEIRDICGIKTNLTTHKFRHYYATRLIRSGVSPAVVQKAMGHANIKMTISTYTHLISDDIANEVKKHIK